MKVYFEEKDGLATLHFADEQGKHIKSISTGADRLLAMLQAGDEVVNRDGIEQFYPFVRPLESPNGERILLDATVYPSTEQTIAAIKTDEQFNGAHNFEIRPMLRYDGGAVYGPVAMPLTFVKKNADGSWQSGFQSEQLLLALLYRHEKLQEGLPGPAFYFHKFKIGLQIALDSLRQRVEERTERGVMGSHKQ